MQSRGPKVLPAHPRGLVCAGGGVLGFRTPGAQVSEAISVGPVLREAPPGPDWALDVDV